MIEQPMPKAGNVDPKLRIWNVEAIGAGSIPYFPQFLSGTERGLDLGPDPRHAARAGCRLSTRECAQMDEIGFGSLSGWRNQVRGHRQTTPSICRPWQRGFETETAKHFWL
jgi:hypothetical protein